MTHLYYAIFFTLWFLTCAAIYNRVYIAYFFRNYKETFMSKKEWNRRVNNQLKYRNSNKYLFENGPDCKYCFYYEKDIRFDKFHRCRFKYFVDSSSLENDNYFIDIARTYLCGKSAVNWKPNYR